MYDRPPLVLGAGVAVGRVAVAADDPLVPPAVLVPAAPALVVAPVPVRPPVVRAFVPVVVLFVPVVPGRPGRPAEGAARRPRPGAAGAAVPGAEVVAPEVPGDGGLFRVDGVETGPVSDPVGRVPAARVPHRGGPESRRPAPAPPCRSRAGVPWRATGVWPRLGLGAVLACVWAAAVLAPAWRPAEFRAPPDRPGPSAPRASLASPAARPASPAPQERRRRRQRPERGRPGPGHPHRAWRPRAD